LFYGPNSNEPSYLVVARVAVVAAFATTATESMTLAKCPVVCLFSFKNQ
jgi:hypothetical protein